MLRQQFHAMGTSMELLLEARDQPETRAALTAARAEIDRLEKLMSRFRPDSELSLLNRTREMRVGPDMARVLGAALSLRTRTGGRFDPTLGRAMVASGYDKTFEAIDKDAPGFGPPAPGSGWAALDPDTRWVALGTGVDLDFGAIAKGDAADRACQLLARAGSCLVNAGGDVVVSGPRAEGPWPVGVLSPRGQLVLNLTSGALATSGTDRRCWRRGGKEIHHAIAPRSCRSADTDVARATAIASTGAEADALATALVIAGTDEATRLADRWRVPALIVDRSDGVTLAGGLQ